jgi:hypothetical protein
MQGPQLSLEQQPLLGHVGVRNRFNSKLNQTTDYKETHDFPEEKTGILLTPVLPPYHANRVDIASQRKQSDIGYDNKSIIETTNQFIISIENDSFKAIGKHFFLKFIEIAASSSENKVLVQNSLRERLESKPSKRQTIISEYLTFISLIKH